MIFLYFLLFFFSSRRRHTRWPRDWSSDVCSSDLNHSFSKLVIENTNHFKYLKASGRNIDYTNKMIEKLHELIDNKIKVGVLSAKLSSLREPMMIVIICGVIALQVTVFKSTLSSVLIILVLFYRAMGYIIN